MPYITYGFMEQIFKSASSNTNKENCSDSKTNVKTNDKNKVTETESIQEFIFKLKKRNYSFAKIIMIIHYIICLLFLYYLDIKQNILYIVYISFFMISMLTLFLPINSVKFVDRTLYISYVLIQTITSIIFIFSNKYTNIEENDGKAFSILTIKQLYLQFFITHIAGLFLFKFNLLLYGCLLVKNSSLFFLFYFICSSNNLDTLNFIIYIIFFSCIMFKHNEFTILNYSINKYGKINNILLKYIENLLNTMFCLFFTFSKNKIVFSNRRVRNFIKNFLAKEFIEMENLQSNNYNFNFSQ